MKICSIGSVCRPFPHARPADALRQEDAFMELHGGRGSRCVYLLVDWLASVGDVRRLARKRNCTPPAGCGARTHLVDAPATTRGSPPQCRDAMKASPNLAGG